MKTQLEAIRAIDPKAAEYIETVVIPRRGWEESEKLVSGKQKLPWKKKKPRPLLDLFLWQFTPQGRDYWLNIWGNR